MSLLGESRSIATAAGREVPRPNGRKRVQLALWYYDRAHHIGIAKYAAQAGWILDDAYAQVRTLGPHVGDADGIISFHGQSLPDIEMLTALSIHKPIVDIGEYAHLSSLPRIRTDAKLIAKLAVEYFISRGFKNVGFVIQENSAHQRRQLAMQEWAGQYGLNFFSFRNSEFRRREVVPPTPIALLAATDGCAVQTLLACEELGLRVPEQVAILGIDNDECRVHTAPVSLSSVDPDMERVGYEAAALLDRLMMGGERPTGPIEVPPLGIVERQSTNIIATEDLEVARAIRYILENYREDINVSTITQHTSVSRRHLQTRFKSAVGMPMLEYLNRQRIDFARQRLHETTSKISEIARACGFGDSVRFIRAFRRYTNMSPGEYRRAHGGGPFKP